MLLGLLISSRASTWAIDPGAGDLRSALRDRRAVAGHARLCAGPTTSGSSAWGPRRSAGSSRPPSTRSPSWRDQLPDPRRHLARLRLRLPAAGTAPDRGHAASSGGAGCTGSELVASSAPHRSSSAPARQRGARLAPDGGLLRRVRGGGPDPAPSHVDVDLGPLARSTWMPSSTRRPWRRSPSPRRTP